MVLLLIARSLFDDWCSARDRVPSWFSQHSGRSILPGGLRVDAAHFEHSGLEAILVVLCAEQRSADVVFRKKLFDT